MLRLQKEKFARLFHPEVERDVIETMAEVVIRFILLHQKKTTGKHFIFFNTETVEATGLSGVNAVFAYDSNGDDSMMFSFPIKTEGVNIADAPTKNFGDIQRGHLQPIMNSLIDTHNSLED